MSETDGIGQTDCEEQILYYCCEFPLFKCTVYGRIFLITHHEMLRLSRNGNTAHQNMVDQALWGMMVIIQVPLD